LIGDRPPPGRRGRLDDRKLRELEDRIDAWRMRLKDTDDRKTYDEVFDRPTLMVIAKLINDGILETLDYPVSTGKEGNVFHGTGPRGAVAVKIYRVSNATFKHLGKYIVGDPRFKGVKRNTRGMVEAWAQKEYRNLRKMAQAGARVPRPVDQRNHVLVMEYIGDETRPAPLLREAALDDPAAVFADVRSSMAAIRRSGLVHGDLSEYNVLMWDGHAVVIDCGQSVPLAHPNADEWFRRDCANVARYFRRLGVDTDAARLEAEVRAG